MKKIFFVLLAMVVLLGAGCAKTNGAKTISTVEGYRKVMVSGTVTTEYSGDLAGVEGLVYCSASGTYEMNFWFAEAGGEALKQDNKLAIADVACAAYGETCPCEVTIPESAHDLRPFTAKANLYPDAAKWLETGGKVETVADQIDFYVPPSVSPPFLEITYACCDKVGTLSDYGASFNQLLLPFLEIWSTSVYIGQPEQPPALFENKELPGNQLADVTISVKEEWVSEL